MDEIIKFAGQCGITIWEQTGLTDNNKTYSTGVFNSTINGVALAEKLMEMEARIENLETSVK